MIKALLNRGNGKKTLIVGLSESNIDLLQKDMPARVPLDDVKETDLSSIDEILILYGRTEKDIMEDLAKYATLPPVKFDPRLA